MKYGISSILTIALIAVSALSQRVTPEPAPPVGAPFTIEPGSTFSASAGKTIRDAAVLGYIRDRGRVESDLAEMLDIVKTNYANAGTNEGSLLRSAIGGALLALDPHSNFFDPTEFRELVEEQQSEYSGIGATIANFRRAGNDGTYIMATFAGSPAASVGLGFGDRILKVDGRDTSGRRSDEVRDMVRGKSGTLVEVLVERSSTGKTESVRLRRRLVSQPSVPDAYMLRPGIGYVDLTSGFTYSTSAEFSSALRSLRRQGLSGLVIDLRGNPGGILEQAVRIAEIFLPVNSLIVSQRGRSKLDNRVWRSNNRKPETVPLVILVDADSASASEILAAALQDHDRALVVGERTFGKGLVQSVVHLPGGAGLALTTGRYFTPSGRSIQRDYSSGNLYDYYNHRTSTGSTHAEVVTAKNRKLLGGDGIDPDEKVSARQLTRMEVELLDPIFFFTRANLMLTGRASRPQISLSANEDMDRAVLDQFSTFVGGTLDGADARTVIDNQNNFIRIRLKYALVMATQGVTAANRVLIQHDPQVLRAAEALPRARQLAMASKITTIR